MSGLLSAVASLVMEHGLWSMWAQKLRLAGSVDMAHGLSCSTACGIFLDQGLNLSLALTGVFFTIEPPGKPWGCFLHLRIDSHSLPLPMGGKHHPRSPEHLKPYSGSCGHFYLQMMQVDFSFLLLTELGLDASLSTHWPVHSGAGGGFPVDINRAWWGALMPLK